MRFDLLTIFPEVFEPYLKASVLGRAGKEGRLEVRTHDIRQYADNKHKTVDGTPYGGGPGMVLKIEPIDKALGAIKLKVKRRIVVLSARGEQFTQQKAKEYAKLDNLTLVCGRYEGIDQRVADYLADEELSVGPYVLAGGELAALVVVEVVARLLPGVLGNPKSLEEESFSVAGLTEPEGRSREYPQYTKPEEYKGWRVPEVLLSGDHEKISKWREKKTKRTMKM